MNRLRLMLSVRTAAGASAAIAAGTWFYQYNFSSLPDTHDDPVLHSDDDERPTHRWHAASAATVAQMEAASNQSNKLLFLGTGSSTGCPRPLCPLLFTPSVDGREEPDPKLAVLKRNLAPFCRTSNLAGAVGDPVHNKDYRNNPSFLIATEHGKNVIIDVGKTFREGALRWLPRYQIRSIDAIVLTHQHMDAAGGLDDIRGFQKYVPVDHDVNKAGNKESLHLNFKQVPMPIFLSEETLGCLQDQFPWLLPKNKTEAAATKDGKPVVARHVASFDVTVFEAFQPIYPVEGLKIIPLPVMHGEDLVSFGFAFSVGTFNAVYLSDISRMLPETLEFIMSKLPQPTHLLVLDALLVDKANPVHFNLLQAMELVEQINPKQTYLVGMNCDSFEPHDIMNEKLRKQYKKHNVQLAHDGLLINVQNANT